MHYAFYLPCVIAHPLWSGLLSDDVVVWIIGGTAVAAVALVRYVQRKTSDDAMKGELTSEFTNPAGSEKDVDQAEGIVIVRSNEKLTKLQNKGKGKNKPPDNGMATAEDLKIIMTKVAEARGRAENADNSAKKAQTDIGQLTSALAKLQQEAATAGDVKTLQENIDEASTRIGTIVEEQTTSKQAIEKLQADLGELNATLSEEIAAHELILKTPKPPPPQHWKILEPKWTLLQRNPALRERLLLMWQGGPVQTLGGRYNQLLRLSERQWTTILLQTPDMPMRLTYWRNLHLEAKRQFVGVSNFFKRLQEFSDRSGASSNDAFDRMTPAEFDFGWPHISDPPAEIIEFPKAQVEQWVAFAAQKLMEHWATPVIRLYHELFVIPRFEYDDPESALDEGSAMSDGGFLTVAEDDVRTAARQLDFDYFPITPYQHVSEVTRYLNHSANKYYEWKDWLDRPVTPDGTRVLRVLTLALKKRSASSEYIGAGASVMIARRTNA